MLGQNDSQNIKNIEKMARVEERIKVQEEATDKLEHEVSDLKDGSNKVKGAIILITLIGSLLLLRSLFFK